MNQLDNVDLAIETNNLYRTTFNTSPSKEERKSDLSGTDRYADFTKDITIHSEAAHENAKASINAKTAIER
jgi:hypothetical protein